MIKIDIYRSFEQWKNGNVLEHGMPRTEYYSEQELSLVEMGWNYGYDAGRAVEQALDKKAENARELGLDYEVAPKIGCVNHDCDQCKTAREPLTDEPEIVQRVKRYAGQTLQTARNPNVTARECIELADWLAAHGINAKGNT